MQAQAFFKALTKEAHACCKVNNRDNDYAAGLVIFVGGIANGVIVPHPEMRPTSDTNTWKDVSYQSGSPLWQNTINPKYFSKDSGQTWYDIEQDHAKQALVNVSNSLNRYNPVVAEASLKFGETKMKSEGRYDPHGQEGEDLRWAQKRGRGGLPTDDVAKRILHPDDNLVDEPSIGTIKLSTSAKNELKRIVVGMWKKNKNIREDEVTENLPEKFWQSLNVDTDAWEMISDEIEDIVFDTLNQLNGTEDTSYVSNKQPGAQHMYEAKESKKDEKEEPEDDEAAEEESEVEDAPKKKSLEAEDIKKVIKLLLSYKGKKIPDPKVHKLAKELQTDVHMIESFIYGLASKYVMSHKVKKDKK